MARPIMEFPPPPPLLLRVLDDVSGPLGEGGPHVPLQFFYYFFIFFPCFSAFDGDTLGSFIFLTCVSRFLGNATGQESNSCTCLSRFPSFSF
jgi:hypothetical protein